MTTREERQYVNKVSVVAAVHGGVCSGVEVFADHQAAERRAEALRQAPEYDENDDDIQVFRAEVIAE